MVYFFIIGLRAIKMLSDLEIEVLRVRLIFGGIGFAEFDSKLRDHYNEVYGNCDSPSVILECCSDSHHTGLS